VAPRDLAGPRLGVDEVMFDGLELSAISSISAIATGCRSPSGRRSTLGRTLFHQELKRALWRSVTKTD